MIDFEFDEYCCGCGLCANVCPTKAIEMVSNYEGFKIPQINKNLCVKCGKCDINCVHINAFDYKKNKKINKNTWMYSSKNNDIKMKSTSGAAFYELASNALSHGYYVSGCVWNEKLKAVHIVSNRIEDIKKMQGSKYVQSDFNNVLVDIKKLLEKGEKILFSGTPCQATSVHILAKNMGEQYRKNVITIAVICHGVSSPYTWESFKKWLQYKHGSKLVKVNFRNKEKKGYKLSFCKYEFESGENVFTPTYLPTSKYIEATLVYNLAIRKSCTHCDCKGVNEACDIIIGDWYEENKGDGELGTSCIVAFTENGAKYIKENLRGLKIISAERLWKINPNIEKSEKSGENRNEFLSKTNDISVWENVEKFYPSKYKLKKILVKLHLYNVIKNVKDKMKSK